MAVKVTGWPYDEGFADDVRFVLVFGDGMVTVSAALKSLPSELTVMLSLAAWPATTRTTEGLPKVKLARLLSRVAIEFAPDPANVVFTSPAMALFGSMTASVAAESVAVWARVKVILFVVLSLTTKSPAPAAVAS